jgi:hypothetical protein
MAHGVLARCYAVWPLKRAGGFGLMVLSLLMSLIFAVGVPQVFANEVSRR